MSDISIPGVTSKYNTDSLIEGLMKVERVPVTRMEESVDEYKLLKTTWQDISRYIGRFRDSAKVLYDFNSPFREKNALSSDDAILTAEAAREAIVEEREIAVLETAQADRFLSRSLALDYSVPAGRYGFTVGDDQVVFTFKGGSLPEFAEAVNRNGKNIVRAGLVKDTPDTQVLMLSSEKTGVTNRLTFTDDSVEFGLAAGILKTSGTSSREITLTDSALRRWTEPLQDSGVTISDGVLHVPTKTDVSFRIDPPVVLPEGHILEIRVATLVLPEDEWVPPSPPPGPDIPNVGGVDLQDIHIENAPSRVEIPPWQAPTPPKRIDDLSIFYTSDGEPLASIQDIPGEQTVSISAADVEGPLTTLNIRNTNTHREIDISSIRSYDPEDRGEYTPVRAITVASDSRIEVDGIPVTRNSNTIDDVIPGVTLHVQRESDRPVSLSVEHDLERVKEAIFQFVGHYDRLLTEISITTSRDESVIDEITYFEDDEMEQARERLGILQGDISLMQLKSSLQRIMMNPYETSTPRELSMLAQIGISTNTGGFGGGLNATKLRGYLEINEDMLNAALENNFDAVRELFGSDSDNDMIIDSGAAYAAERYVKPYIETGGIVSSRVGTMDSRIDTTEDRIEDLEEKLEDKEARYRREYGAMEGALRTLEESSKSLDNMFNRNNE
jgi:flagellar hook-associated protein 2